MIVGSSVILQLIIGFLLALMFARVFPLRRILLMLVLTPMMLSFVSVGVFFKLYYEPTFGLVSWVINHVTSEPFVMLATPGGRHRGHRHRRCVDVVALRHAVGARRPGERPEISLRGRRDRPRLMVATLFHHHLSLHQKPAAARGALQNHRDLQAVRSGLHHHRRRPRLGDRKPSPSTSTAWPSSSSAPANQRPSRISCCSS